MDQSSAKNLDYEIDWTPKRPDTLPSDTKAYYLLTIMADGTRRIIVDRWLNNGEFQRAGYFGYPVLAWHKVVKPFPGMACLGTGKSLRWYAPDKLEQVIGVNAIHKHPTETFLVFTANDLQVFSWIDFETNKGRIEHWTPMPIPYDNGDGSPWWNRTDEYWKNEHCISWKLRDIEAQRNLFATTGGEFGRQLNRACAEQMDNESSSIEISVPDKVTVYIKKADIVRSRCFVPESPVNIWPEVWPPLDGRYADEWYAVEYEDHGKRKSGTFKFDGTSFVNEKQTLKEDRYGNVKILGFGLWNLTRTRRDQTH